MGIRGKRDKEKTMLTEEVAQRMLSKLLSTSTIRYDMDNLFVFDWESDKLIKTKSGYLYEYEIKISKSDFKNDFKNKKLKHAILSGEKYTPDFNDWYEQVRRQFPLITKDELFASVLVSKFLTANYKRPNYFYYAVPEGMLKTDDIPEYAGLVYLNPDIVHWPSVVKPAPLLHKDKYSDEELNLTEKFYYNMVNWKERSFGDRELARASELMLQEELQRKNQVKTYAEIEAELKEAKDEAEILRKRVRLLNEDLSVYRKERRLMLREIRKHEPSFDVSEIEKAAMED